MTEKATEKRPVRWWAVWRRVQYALGFFSIWAVVGVGVYFLNYYEPANCFDGRMNADESGVDCGGARSNTRPRPGSIVAGRSLCLGKVTAALDDKWEAKTLLSASLWMDMLGDCDDKKAMLFN